MGRAEMVFISNHLPIAVQDTSYSQVGLFCRHNALTMGHEGRHATRVISRANEATDLRLNTASRSSGFGGFGRLVF
jgi:hypothetical protein